MHKKAPLSTGRLFCVRLQRRLSMFALLIVLVSFLSSITLVAGHPTIDNPWAQVDQIIRQKTLIPSIEFYSKVVQAIEDAQQKNPTFCVSTHAEKKRLSYCAIRDALVQIAQLNREPLAKETVETQIALFSTIRRTLPSTDHHYAQFECNLIEAYKKQIHVSLWGDQPDFATAKSAIDNMLFIRRLPEAEEYWKKQRKQIDELEKKVQEEAHNASSNLQRLTALSNLYANLYHYPSEIPQKKNKIIAELEKAIKTEKAIHVYNRAQQHDANNHARLLAMSCCLASQQPHNPLWQCAIAEHCYLTLLNDLGGSSYFNDFSDCIQRENIRDAITLLEQMKPSDPALITRFAQIKNKVIAQLSNAEYLDRLIPMVNLCDSVGHQALMTSINACQANFGNSTTTVMLDKRKSTITVMHKSLIDLIRDIRTITYSEDHSSEHNKKVLTVNEKYQQLIQMNQGFSATQTALKNIAQPIVHLTETIQSKQRVLEELRSTYAFYREQRESCDE